jgi:galactose mutarotase-like enzyme
MYRKQRNYGCRIHDEFTYKGMQTIVMENEKVRISILPDKGTEIYEFLYKPFDLDIMWLSTKGIQNPFQFSNLGSDPSLSFIDFYSGAWQEVFPNGGPPSSSLGASFGQHEEVSLLPWDYRIIEDTQEKICVEFLVQCRKTPFLLKKRLILESGSSKLTIEEEAENCSEAEIPTMWGQHLAFGYPFLDQNCYIEIPGEIKIVPHQDSMADRLQIQNDDFHDKWPFITGEDGNRKDISKLPEPNSPSQICYLTGFEAASYSVVNPQKNASVTVAWDESIFPYLWFWQEYGNDKVYPWYGRHYNIGLEPFSSIPTSGIEEAVKNKTALVFNPRETKKFNMSVEINELLNLEI